METDATALSALPRAVATTETDKYGVERLPYRPEGWNFWEWNGNRIHYIQAGSSGPPLVLVHGFGASAYHWRYNIPELAKTHRVYAVCMLGFGWSDKPVIDYYAKDGSNVWADQIGAFIREVVQQDSPGEKVVLAGNSLGGYNSLSAAAKYPELVRGLVLLNGAGRFEEEGTQATMELTLEQADQRDMENILSSWLKNAVEAVSSAVKRAVLYITFQQTKQPARILQVLNSVYVSKQNLDDDLVASIVAPSIDPNAPAVFYKVISGQGVSVNRLLSQLDAMPMLLLWGDNDPWIVPAKAAQVQRLYPRAEKIGLVSGHCPHDDTPAEVNEALAKWVAQLP